MLDSDVIIAYGSETGNCEAIAEKLCLELEKCFFKVSLQTLNSITKISNISEIKYLVIVCSTCGQGDPPKGADKFVSFIKKKKEALSIKFTLLGLGDSNYSKFMFIPRLIYENLIRLDCQLFFNKREADEAYGLEEVVEPWIDGLVKEFIKIRQESNSNNSNEIKQLKENNCIEKNIENDEVSNIHIDDNINDVTVLIEKSLVSGPKAMKKILKIKLHNSNSKFSNYQPGSNISILPKLKNKKLQFLKNFINIKLDNQNVFEECKISDLPNLIKKNHNKIIEYLEMIKYTGLILTKQDLLELFMDFNSIIKKTNFEKFILTIKNSESIFKYDDISKENRSILLEILEYMFDNYTNTIINNKLSFYDVFKGIHNIINEKNKSDSQNTLNISLDELLDFSQLKYPRKYSISTYNNSSDIEFYLSIVEIKYQRILKLPNNLKINFIKTKHNKIFYGETSYYLNNLNLNDNVYVCDINNDFIFPVDNIVSKEGLIYISNGTGITPMLSYLKMLKEENVRETGKIVIISGLRSRSNEYNESIEENVIEDHGEKCNYYACISSAINEESENECGIWRNLKINFEYIQDIIIEKKDLIYELFFENNSTIMICGDLDKILDDITNILVGIIKNKLNIDRNKALFLVEEKKINGKIIVEKWS